MKRCPVQGKRKFRDAGEAARYVEPHEPMRLYRCPHCGYFHLSKQRRLQRA